MALVGGGSCEVVEELLGEVEGGGGHVWTGVRGLRWGCWCYARCYESSWRSGLGQLLMKVKV